MIVFVTGGTGALGRPTVARLREAGHTVRALARSAAAAAALRAAGAEPVPASLFDPRALAVAVRGADAVLHLATRIAPASAARRRDAWRENDRIRAEGTRTLVDAALAADVGVLVYPSFAPVYADGGARWLSAGDPVAPTAVLRSTLVAEDEVARFTAEGGRGVSLRMAGIYGPHSPATCSRWPAAACRPSPDRRAPTSRWCGTTTRPRRWSWRRPPPAWWASTTSPTTSP